MPHRSVVHCKHAARDILTGDLPGPYSDQRARTFARLALVDPAAYQTHQRKPDDQLARLLKLPAIEIAHVRHDQAHITT